jgi:hypothetical protein
MIEAEVTDRSEPIVDIHGDRTTAAVRRGAEAFDDLDSRRPWRQHSRPQSKQWRPGNGNPFPCTALCEIAVKPRPAGSHWQQERTEMFSTVSR